MCTGIICVVFEKLTLEFVILYLRAVSLNKSCVIHYVTCTNNITLVTVKSQ